MATSEVAITSVGGYVAWRRGVQLMRDPNWPPVDANWRPDDILKKLGGIGWLEPQDDDAQEFAKKSWLAHGVQDEHAARAEILIALGDLQANIILSGEPGTDEPMFCDALPHGVHKESAYLYIAQKIAAENEGIQPYRIFADDSKNGCDAARLADKVIVHSAVQESFGIGRRMSYLQSKSSMPPSPTPQALSKA